GVAPGAAEHGRGRAVRCGAEAREALFAELRGCGAHGEAHVGAGVSVRDGEYVELVYELPVLFKGGAGAEDYVSEHRRINKLSQEGLPPGADFLSVSVDEHGVDIDIHALDGNSGGLGDLVGDLVYNAPAEGHEVDAVVHSDVEAE